MIVYGFHKSRYRDRCMKVASMLFGLSLIWLKSILFRPWSGLHSGASQLREQARVKSVEQEILLWGSIVNRRRSLILVMTSKDEMYQVVLICIAVSVVLPSDDDGNSNLGPIHRRLNLNGTKRLAILCTESQRDNLKESIYSSSVSSWSDTMRADTESRGICRTENETPDSANL